MPYSADVRKKVAEAFEEKRKAAFDNAENRKQQLYMSVEGIREIDRKLTSTGLRIYAEALKKNDPEPLDIRIARLKEENRELADARAAILEAAGYPRDFSDVKYECVKCCDTGYIGIDPCECFVAAHRKEAYLSSGLGGMLSGQTFDNFDVSLYPENVRDSMQFILDETRKYADSFGTESCRDKNLAFFGGTGLGKTHISTAIASRLIDRGYYVIYDTAVNILQNFEKERFSRDSEKLTEKYTECELLIIDDLGSEFKNSYTHATLFTLLNSRIYSDKATIISTNLPTSIPAMRKIYDERIVSRIIGEFKTFIFKGEDIRLKNRKNSKS